MLTVFIIALLAPIPLFFVFQATYSSKIATNIEDVEPVDTALVLGNKLKDGEISEILTARLDAAYTLYEQGKVTSLILSGGGEEGKSEAEVMQEYLLAKGVPESAMKLETSSTNTLGNCKQTKETYDLKRTVIVSQAEHLVRAIYLCNALGIKSTGFASGGSYAPISYLYEAYALAIDMWRVML